MYHKMFYVGPDGKQLSTSKHDGNPYDDIHTIIHKPIRSSYYSVGDYFKTKRHLQPEDIVSLLRDKYWEAAKVILEETGIDILMINRNFHAEPPINHSRDWFKARGYKLANNISDTIKLYKNNGSHEGVKYIYFTYVNRKVIRQGDKLISDEIRDNCHEDTVFLCYCEQFEEVYPDLKSEPNVYLAYTHFFDEEYKDHIYYPTIKVRTDDEERPSVSHCSAYFYSLKNIAAFHALVTQKCNYINAELQYTAMHKDSVIGVESYLCKIVR